MSEIATKKFLLGIVGGMGPLAGVHFQKLLIEATNAQRDQDHVPVVCFTDPQIPDRTVSLSMDGGASYVREIVRAGRILEKAGASALVMPCITAHARFSEIASMFRVPMVSLVVETERFIRLQRDVQKILVLATDGAIRANIFEGVSSRCGACLITPNVADQREVMHIIYDIKRGEREKATTRMWELLRFLTVPSVGAVILGCTELSLFFEELSLEYRNTILFIDPMRITARAIADRFSGTRVGSA